MNWQNLVKKFKNFWLFAIKIFKKFVEYMGDINVFWYKNMSHYNNVRNYFRLVLSRQPHILGMRSNNYFIFLIYCSMVILLIIFILLFLKIISEITCYDSELRKSPVDLGIFTEKHLLDFYIPEKDLQKNLEKLCFSEGIAALSFNLIGAANLDDKTLPLRQVLGKEYYEYFKKYSLFLLANAPNITSVSYFLNTVLYHESYVDRGFLESKFKNFIFGYSMLFGEKWHPKMSFAQEVLYYRQFWTLEELRPLSIPSIFKLYDKAVNSSKFFKYTYENGVTFGYYSDCGKTVLKDFININGQDWDEIYMKAHSYCFDEQKGFIYKVKNILQHLYKFTRFYEKNAGDYYFFCGNICSDETDILNFLYLDIFVTSNKAAYLQFLIEIELAQTLNTILYYPSVANGRYFIKQVIKELRAYLQLSLDKGIFKDTDDYVYVETLHGDHRVRRLIKKYLNIILKGCFIKDEKTVALYKEHAPIFHSILSDNSDLLKKKITYKQALKALDFIDKLIDKIKKEEDFLAKKHFPNINEIRKKKIYTKYFINSIDVERNEVFAIYYGPQSKDL
jgi:hypothetical protein